jgi:DNA invertase Pin-like site-specific DNA recombinase
MAKKAVLYARVSTDGQTTQNQLMELRAAAERHGWQVVHEYIDRGISGAKRREERPGFQALSQALARKDFDIMLAWSVDRLGRSLQDLVGFLTELHAKKVDLYLHKQGIDTTTPSGKMMFHMLGVFAEFERTMIQERVMAGLARARKEGKRLGRPPISPAAQKAILLERKKGKGIRKIASELQMGVGTVKRIIDGREAA